jgi:hypothetical protein
MTQGTTTGGPEDFAAHLLGVCNSSLPALMIGAGRRTRLFDVMAALPPSAPDGFAGL